MAIYTAPFAIANAPKVVPILESVGGPLATRAWQWLNQAQGRVGIMGDPGLGESESSGADQTARLVPELGRKLDFVLGKATGSLHNIQRSTAMLAQLEKLGLPDTAETRAYLEQHLSDALNAANNVVMTQDNGRVVRETLLMAPGGALKVQSIWDGVKLITVKLFGGS